MLGRGSFDVAKYSYLQFGVVIPYLALGPTIVGGTITLGQMQQIVRAFGRVESSFQFLVRSWSTIVELISIYQRLRAFAVTIEKGDDASASKGSSSNTVIGHAARMRNGLRQMVVIQRRRCRLYVHN